MIPFRKNELTKTVNPVKLYEYSAAGKPTVTTGFSEDVLQFKEIIFIGDSAEEFIGAVRAALKASGEPNRRESLRAFARRHDWGAMMSPLVDLFSTIDSH